MEEVGIINRHRAHDKICDISSNWLSQRLNHRGKQPPISEILDESTGLTRNRQDDIKHAFLSHFNCQYKKQEPDLSILVDFLNNWKIELKESEIEALDSPISENEIEKAIKQTSPTKAPGPDGITGIFFINFSEQIIPS